MLQIRISNVLAYQAKSETRPTTKKGNRVYWNEKPGDIYVATGVLHSGERVKFISENWREIQKLPMKKGTRWILRNGRKWKINNI